MHFNASFSSLLALFALASSASAHGVLTAVKGANGITAQGFGVISTTPRTGTTRNPFQQDTSIIRNIEIQTNRAGVCGRTLAGGNNNVAAQLAAAASAGLPSVNADGTVTMTLHQINGDGAGPYTCAVSADGTGADFVAMTVTTNVPGRNSRSNAKATDFPLVAQMPAGMTCKGGPNGDACIVRCRNAAAAGPFGGCAAVTNVANNTTTTSAVVSSSVAATVSSTDSAAATTTVATDSAAVSSTAVATSTAATDSAAVNSTAVATSTAATDSAVVSSTATSTDAAATTTGVAVDAVKVGSTGSTCGRRMVRRSSRRSPVSDDEELAKFDEEETNDDDVSLEEADRLLAEDLEKFRFRAKRLADRLERVKRSRIIGDRDLY